jgi:hypothetical protein
MNLPTGTRRKDKKRPSAPSPQLTPRTSGAKRLVVRDDDVSVSSETLVAYEEDGMTAKLLKLKFFLIFPLFQAQLLSFQGINWLLNLAKAPLNVIMYCLTGGPNQFLNQKHPSFLR